MLDFLTIPEIVDAARNQLDKYSWDYAAGGAETEATLRRNRAALAHYRLRPRVGRNVLNRSTRTSLLGVDLAMPVVMAPVGGISQYAHGDGVLASARASVAKGVSTIVGTLTEPVLEEVAANTPGPLFFQLYIRGDREWLKGLVRRAEAAGFRGLCLTMDSAVYGRRERDIHSRFDPRTLHKNPNLIGIKPDPKFQTMFTWDDLAYLREITRLPIMAKGIMTPQDALLAVERGMDCIYVSNHAGRQLDCQLAAVEVLPEIVDAVGGKAEILVDGGFMRATDILKAIALGARAVALGKLQCFALAAGGQAGLERALEILSEEMLLAMGSLGVTDLSQLDRSYVTFTPWIEALD